MTETQEDYLKLEYKKLNDEISKLSDEIRVRERYATTFSPLAGAWVFINFFKEDGFKSNPNFYLSIIICVLTFIVVLLYGLSVLLLYKNILVSAKYVKRIENYFFDDESTLEFGWEKFYENKVNNKSKLVGLAKISWIIYLCLPLTMAAIILLNHYSK